MLAKYKKLIPIIILTMVGVFAFGLTVFAQTKSEVGTGSDIAQGAVYIVGKIVEYIVSALGQITLVLIQLLISVAKYNTFVDSDAVTQGWVIVRDVVNMFFIVILLVIAFGTILGVQNYSYKQMLPRLLIMAVVINFSRTIAGLLIDFGQVVMLTFVNGFQAAAGGNFVNALRINDLLTLNESSPLDVSGVGTILVGYILALFAMVITMIVIGVMLAILVMRIIVLQFLIVLSPLAFITSVWPSQKEKYAKWWGMFIDNIIVGPIFAFFLWLSLLVLGSGTIGSDLNVKSTGEGTMPSIGVTKFGSLESMASYVFGIGMLMMSLYMAQSMKTVGSGLAGKALGGIQNYAKAGARKIGMAPVNVAKWGARKAGEGALRAGEGVATGALGGLSKLPAVLGGGLALKGAAALQARARARASKESAYVSNLTPEQRDLRLRQLESLPVRSKSQKNQLAALYRERLGGLGREEWKPDGKNAAGEDTMTDKKTGKVSTKNEWYKEKREEVRKINEFAKTRKVEDPALHAAVMALEDQRMDFGTDAEVKENASKLSTSQAAVMSTKVLKDDRVIEGMGEDNRLHTKQHGGAERRRLIEEWEKKKYGGTPTTEALNALAKAGRLEVLIKADDINLQNADLKANGGIIAKQVASAGSEEMKQEFRAKRAKDYTDGLKQSMQQPGDHSDARAELLQMEGGNFSEIYGGKIDKGGRFADTEIENQFVQDLKKIKKDNLPDVIQSLNGEAREKALESLSGDDLKRFARRGENIDIIKEYVQTAQKDYASDEMKRTAERISALPSISAVIGGSKKSAKATSGVGAREVELEKGEGDIELDESARPKKGGGGAGSPPPVNPPPVSPPPSSPPPASPVGSAPASAMPSDESWDEALEGAETNIPPKSSGPATPSPTGGSTAANVKQAFRGMAAGYGAAKLNKIDEYNQRIRAARAGKPLKSGDTEKQLLADFKNFAKQDWTEDFNVSQYQPSAPISAPQPAPTGGKRGDGGAPASAMPSDESWDEALGEAEKNIPPKDSGAAASKKTSDEQKQTIDDLRKRMDELNKLMDEVPVNEAGMFIDEDGSKRFDELNKEHKKLAQEWSRKREENKTPEQRKKDEERRQAVNNIQQEYNRKKAVLTSEWEQLRGRMRKLDPNSEKWKRLRTRQESIRFEEEKLEKEAQAEREKLF